MEPTSNYLEDGDYPCVEEYLGGKELLLERRWELFLEIAGGRGVRGGFLGHLKHINFGPP